MSTNPADVPAPPRAAPGPKEGRGAAFLSPRELFWRRFNRHGLAVASLHILVALYLVALLADFLTPWGPAGRDLGRIYCPPQIPSFRLAEGWTAPVYRRELDPVTLKSQYWHDSSVRVPLGFFVPGEPYRFLGLFEARTRLFGVDRERLDPTAAADPALSTWYALGADRYGQDLFSRLLHGSRVSLSIGFVAVLITFLLGILIGGVSGYCGGRIDNFIQRGIEIVNALPSLPLWMALGAIVPRDWPPLQTYFTILLVLSLLGWTGLARVVRGKILALREEDYAVAARLLGASHARVLFRHLVPGFTSHIVVSLTMSVPGMILGETALSFLGLGLRPPAISWGVMLQDCLSLQTVGNYPWLLVPVVAIVLTVLAYNFLGDGLRDAADPYASR